MTENTTLKMKMYCFVPYNISDKQKGIQSWHAAQWYDMLYKDDEMTWEFIKNHTTAIMLDGGTTNNSKDPLKRGSLNLIADTLWEAGIKYATFFEPDLNDALTSVIFIADERVWDYETYPEFYDWLLEVKLYPESKHAIDLKNPQIRRFTQEQFKETFPEYYNQWVQDILGGHKNEVMRNLTRGKKLA